MKKEFYKDFIKILEKLKNNEHFAFSRFSDGELYILQNRKVEIKQNTCFVREQHHSGYWGESDYKEFIPGRDDFLRKYLQKCFSHEQKNYLRGISCRCCVGEDDWQWQFENFPNLKSDEQITWSNALINGNYRFFIEQMVPVIAKKEVVIVCNKKSKIENLPFNIIKDFRIGNNCHTSGLHLVQEMKQWICDNNIEDKIFLFSAASLSNILIYELFKEYNNNTYIDIGSNLNPVICLEGWEHSRQYLRGYWLGEENNPYYNKVCVW